jgi:hypothetical protein
MKRGRIRREYQIKGGAASLNEEIISNLQKENLYI